MHPSKLSAVPATSQAAFGPFYRITQLILTTTPATNSSQTTPSGLPAIVTGVEGGGARRLGSIASLQCSCNRLIWQGPCHWLKSAVTHKS